MQFLSKLLITALLLFALVGLGATVFIFRELYLESKYDELYINNCSKVEVGMSLEEAKIIMGGENYYENEKSFSYFTQFEKGLPTKFSIDYPTSGSSYHVSIYYNPDTGLVNEVVCSGF